MMNKVNTAVMLSIVALMITSCNLSGSPQINIKEARLVPSRALIGVASAYLIINNIGNGTDKLTGCIMKDMPSVKCRLHDVIDGKMVQAEEIPIPAGETTSLKKGFQHLMLYGLPNKIGNQAVLILIFKNSGPLDIRADINQH